MKIKGIINREIFWWNGQCWTDHESDAASLTRKEAGQVIRVRQANTRFLDEEDRAIMEIIEES